MKQDKKVIGIKEIAKLAGVSIGTVDRVIHDRPGVSGKTKEKVQTIIDESGYNPNPIARRLAGFNSIYRIAIILPRENDYNPFWKQHLTGVANAFDLVSQFGIELETYFFEQSNPQTFIDIVNDIGIDGCDAAVIAPIFQDLAKKFINRCNENNIPVICIDTDLSDTKKLSFIGQDAYRSGAMAGKLISWHVKDNDQVLICHSTTAETLSYNLLRRETGFKEYLCGEHGLREENIIQAHIRSTEVEIIKEELQSYFHTNKNIKAIFVPSTRSFLIVPGIPEEIRNDIFLVGYDLVHDNIDLLNKGIIDVLISQKPEEQCYKAILFLYEKLITDKEVEPFLNVPIDIILKENIGYYVS